MSPFQSKSPWIKPDKPVKDTKSLLTTRSCISLISKAKSMEVLENKLGYEWRNIYRVMDLIDASKSGLVLKSEFEKCLFRFKQRTSFMYYTL